MSTRGFVRGRLAAVFCFVSGLLAVVSLPGPASAAGQWTGGYLGFKTDFDDLEIEYANTGTPKQSLQGLMAGVTAGYDVQFGNIVLGIAGDASFGKLSAFVRDGNYITESGEVTALGAVRGRIGVAINNFLPFVTGGITFGNLDQGEVCPAPAAAPFGFCNTHGPFNLKGTQFILGGSIGGGFEYMFQPGWSVELMYLHTFFPATTFVLSPDAGGNPLPPSVAKPVLDMASAAFLMRF